MHGDEDERLGDADYVNADGDELVDVDGDD